MEQPRFGGVALPPLSTPDGEGMSTESVTYTMESTKFPTLGLHHATQNGCSDVGRGYPDVQEVMEVLRQLGITPQLERHKLKHERQRKIEVKSADDEVYCKNLLLKDKKGQAYLILCEENDTADLHVVKYHLKAQGNLHFASKDSLWRLLHVQPGAISPLALIHSSGDVRVLIDSSLVKKIDCDFTKLYFHPLKADLQVALTLSQLETFLRHHDITLERLPSLTSYSARRRYNNLTGGCRYKHKSNQEHKLKESKTGDVHDEVFEETSALQQTVKCVETMEQEENTFTQHSVLFQQLGISVEIVSAKDSEGALNYTALPCRSVYLKDKRNNYFLFICHENQKVDFSTLKQQLKPRKKIVPLDKEELWSLLHLHENQEHPFALAQLKQPQFLVAISDNLDHKGDVVLTFPHPNDLNLRLQITLQHLETFINNTNHDLMTIQMKGNIEELQAMSASTAYFSSPKAGKLNKVPESPEAESQHFCLPDPVDERHHHLFQSQEMDSAFSPAGQGNNLFYNLTAPLREWILRYIRSFVQLMNRYLPNQILAVLGQSRLWNMMLTSGNSNTEDHNDQSEEHANGIECTEKEEMAKIAKLQQLIKQSGIQVDLTEIQSQTNILQDDVEQCSTYLLKDGLGRPFIILCAEHPSHRNLQHLRKAFRLHVMNDADTSHLLSWPEESSMSWTQEDLSPLALMDIDLSTSGKVRVGMTGPLYLFHDTMLRFDLHHLGVTLWMKNDDLEKMIMQLGFCLVYLP